jgi:PAS domain S-box-containing protein
MKTAQGKLIGVLGIARDISCQHEAFKALREREDIYSSIVGQASDGIVLIDPETYGFVEFNDTACQMLGHDRDAFARLTLFDLPADHTADQIRALMAVTLARGGGHFEIRQRYRDGSTGDCWSSYRVLQFRGRTLVNAIWHDNTERKTAEAALRDERQLRAILTEAIPGICYALDHGSRLLYWNQTFEHLMERSPEALKGLDLCEFFKGGARQRRLHRPRCGRQQGVDARSTTGRSGCGATSPDCGSPCSTLPATRSSSPNEARFVCARCCCRSRAARSRSGSRSRMPASVLPPNSRRVCSRRSSRLTDPPRTSTAAPGSDWC